MSRVPRGGPNGTGGYTNGYGGYGQGNDDSYESSRRPSGDDRRRERRPGGYGGFSENDREQERRPGGYGGYGSRPPPQEDSEQRRPGGYGGYGGFSQSTEESSHVARPTSLERSDARRRSGTASNSRSRSRPGAGRYGPGSQQMEEILQEIQDEFEFMTNDQCVPIDIALKFMDSSSLGLANQYSDFRRTYQELQRGLKTIVNEHHQGFNSSIGTFHKIQTTLQQSQHRVRNLKDSLTQAKTQLSTTKPELKEFAMTSQNYDEMIQVLNVIEQLQLVPDKLEARISEKRFLSAVDILQDALRMIRRSEMEGIGALSDLRIYLSNQEHSLTDILIEELHNHLYLKSPYCEDRWKAYAQNQAKSDVTERPQADAKDRLLYHFLDRLDTSEQMTDDSPRNPEADTFQYMQLVVESLNKMNRLDLAIDTIEQRLPIELFKVVEKSNNEVAQRHPTVIRAYAAKKGTSVDLGPNGNDLRSGLLKDLLWTLYARFEAIAESHRVVHDVVMGIVRREGASSGTTLTRGFKELWKLYQSEMRSLLHDYLATDGDLAYRGGQGQTQSGSVFSRGPRDKNKPMFKLSDMDIKSTELMTEREDLEFILKSSVPGLVSDSKQPDDLSTAAHVNLDGSATGHKLLIEPSVFNMGILLPPSLEFLNRLKEVVPPGSDIVMSTLTSFLDDFLVNVFHPQLDETLIEMSSQTFIDLDAFQQEPQWARFAKKPIFKGTAQFLALITAFCKMLDSLPHDQAFSQLIITQMKTYAQKCNGWYKALVSRSEATESGRRMKASAAFANSEEMNEVITSLFQADAPQYSELLEKEISMLLKEVENDPLDDADIIRDKKSITGLCLLYTSMKWLATKIAQLRHISEVVTNSTQSEAGNQRQNRRWTHLTSTEPSAEGLSVYLPLNKETANEFDQVVLSFQSLSNTALKNLHLEIRTQIIYSLYRTVKTDYNLDMLLTEPDPAVVSLNNALISFDGEVSTFIPPSQYKLITTGLSPLMDLQLLSLSKGIESMNANGCAHMQLNTLVLQQNLKNIESKADLQYSAMFFDLFTSGADAIVSRAKKDGKGMGLEAKGGELFGYDTVKKLIELTYSEKLVSERREVGVQAKRQLDAHLLEISEALY
ncbi:hypothetical protein BU24DRAFT_453075 [Aaosphaeria arxii CBS 175.79]|uniref:Exocyst complex component Sec8 n=1 Tax=Aaosphaeria arxii CBS 175.79 TaxID=1450172 RepID=A0A6A5XK87_9PLEO|nr:uncharacterized protein BU24DRAFT_453075 [Aaosphaeria arxii CBS 175.79]KAF2012714.1 hypothetical protein BU24DRAFT_453075 [Aaosphaeria arxii CBS 175.79]